MIFRGSGNVWTCSALVAYNKLIASWLVGGRGVDWASVFMKDVAYKLKSGVQVTTGGLKAYLPSVD